VTNAQLVQEKNPLAERYGNQSIAEKKSIDVSWQFFMDTEFANLRECVCPNPAELQRFRELINNTVLATDVVDKSLKEKRNERWASVFCESGTLHPNSNHLKAQIVLEHLIQASDVCHTMQHWHVYQVRFSMCSLALRIIPSSNAHSCLARNGTSAFLRRCTKPLRMAGQLRTLPTRGSKERLASLTFMSSHL
jgi:hypothetical protein